MKKELLDKVLIYFMITIWVLLIIATIICVYPFKIAEFENPLEVVNTDKTVKAGDLLLFNRDSEKFMDISGTVSCSFEDDIIFNIPSRISNLPIGNYDSTTSVVVPKNLPPSEYQYKCTIVYKIFGFREVTVYMNTEYFKVIE